MISLLAAPFPVNRFKNHLSNSGTGSGNCLGRIEQSTKSVSWWNYNSVMERVAHFGDGLYQLLGGDEFISGRKGEAACVGIYSANCPEYIIAEYGSYWHSLVVVPIYDTLGPNACSYISNQGNHSAYNNNNAAALLEGIYGN